MLPKFTLCPSWVMNHTWWGFYGASNSRRARSMEWTISPTRPVRNPALCSGRERTREPLPVKEEYLLKAGIWFALSEGDGGI